MHVTPKECACTASHVYIQAYTCKHGRHNGMLCV